MKLMRAALFLSLFFSLLVTAKTLSSSERVVVFGDVHGAYEELTSMLQDLKLVDKADNWAGGKSLLVSLGDLVDRGAQSRQVVELLMNIQAQAQAAGGAFEMVLGNHEIMVMTGDYRYVSKAEFASFADLETPEDRAMLKQHFEALKQAGMATEASFDELFPKGFMGLYRAYQPGGHLGKWLRAQAGAMIKLNDSVLVHGGVSRSSAQQGISAINNSVAVTLTEYSAAMDALFEAGQLPFILPNFDGVTPLENLASGRAAVKAPWLNAAKSLSELRSSVLFSSSGPFWYRGNVNCLQIPESYTTDIVKNRLDVSRIIVGHTVKYRKIARRMDGDVLMLDTGMLQAYYNGAPSALVMENGELTAHHFSGKLENTFFQSSDVFKHNPQGMNDGDIEAFLSSAKVVSSRRIGTGITNSRVIELEKDGRQMRALFKTFDNSKDLQNKTKWIKRYNDADRYYYEVVSYKLDRALGLYMIPPAVIRTIDGAEGVVQYWVENGFTENVRRDDNLGFNGYCELSNYNNVRVVFDTFIRNVDRNNGNLLWDKEFHLTFIDHSQSFDISLRKPRLYSRYKIRLSSLFRKRLQGLSDEQIDNAAVGLLNAMQVDALKKRRDHILKNAE